MKKSESKETRKRNQNTAAVDKTDKMSKDDKINFVVGLTAVLAVFAIFAAIIVYAGTRTGGEIAYAGEAIRGSRQVFTYKNKNLKKGDTVRWYVDGRKVTEYIYESGDANLVYTPTEVGNHTVKVIAGNASKSTTLKVGKPTLTVTAKNAEMTYGDEMPELRYECEGFVCDDSADCLECEIECKNYNASCGNYEISLNATCENYDIKCQNGTLTVKPKELTLKKFVKVYDQTTDLNADDIELDGVLDGDDVKATADKLQFSSKNAGEQTVNTQSIILSGADSANYVICDNAEGQILPKELTLKGLIVSNKSYDGTTKAQISKMGTLEGICEGDSVAVGSLDIAFASADVGTQKIDVQNVVLVGYDKENYTLKNVEVDDAEITKEI